MDHEPDDIAPPPVVYPQKIPIARSSVNEADYLPAPIQAHSTESSKNLRHWQFNITNLQVVVFVVALAFAFLGAIVHEKFENNEFITYLIIMLITPMGLMIIFGVTRGLYAFWQQWQQEREWFNNQKRPPDEE